VHSWREDAPVSGGILQTHHVKERGMLVSSVLSFQSVAHFSRILLNLCYHSRVSLTLRDLPRFGGAFFPVG
jgi:hypothetical protein